LAIIHPDWKMDDQLSLACAQVKAHILVQIHKVGDGVQLGLGNSVGALALELAAESIL
jgi:hypothetical protein